MANFNLNKKVVTIDVNGEDYIATVDIKTVAHYKNENKTSFLQDIQKVSELDEVAIIQLLGSIIRKSERANPVGVKFFSEFNPIAIIEAFTPVLIEVLGVNMPEAKDEDEKK